MFEIPIPNDIDGRVISDIFETFIIPKYIDPDEDATTHKSVSGEDFEAVADRLKSLGYLQ
jgi:hypothetical protein